MKFFVFLSIILSSIASNAALSARAQKEISLIGIEEIPGDTYEDGAPGRLLEDNVTRDNQIGGLGGAIDYLGKGNSYVMTPDRGPGAGQTTYKERFYYVEIPIPGKNNPAPRPRVFFQRILRNEKGNAFTGNSRAYDIKNPPNSLRLDAEGVRVSRSGNQLYISDEYGPHIDVFSIRTGRRIRSIDVPNKFSIDAPSEKGEEELLINNHGRQPNRGFEGISITHSGRYIFAITQDPLLQDCDSKDNGKPKGIKNRILRIDLMHGNQDEYEYLLDSEENGVSEIIALNDHHLMTLERDSKSGAEARTKKIYLIDTKRATNIKHEESLSKEHKKKEDRANRIIPVEKKPLVDLLKLGINDVPEKFEGMTFGPDIDHKTKLLVISTDNDFKSTEPTRIFLLSVPKPLIKM